MESSLVAKRQRTHEFLGRWRSTHVCARLLTNDDPAQARSGPSALIDWQLRLLCADHVTLELEWVLRVLRLSPEVSSVL